MKKVKYTFSSEDLRIFLNILELNIQGQYLDFTDKLQICILNKLFKRLRNKWEDGNTKITFSFRPEEALALYCFYEIDKNNSHLFQRNLLNQINQKTHQLFI